MFLRGRGNWHFRPHDVASGEFLSGLLCIYFFPQIRQEKSVGKAPLFNLSRCLSLTMQRLYFNSPQLSSETYYHRVELPLCCCSNTYPKQYIHQPPLRHWGDGMDRSTTVTSVSHSRSHRCWSKNAQSCSSTFKKTTSVHCIGSIPLCCFNFLPKIIICCSCFVASIHFFHN